MTAQITRWGNSQGVRLSKKILELAGMQMDEEVDVFVENGRIMLEKMHRHQTLEERAAAYGGRLGPYEEYDWGEPVGREAW